MIYQNSWSDKERGLSITTIRHKKKNYVGKARLHPDDKHNWSEFTGCRYAEIRAEIKALKAELKEKKQSCEECRKFVNAVMQYKNFNREDPSSKAMFRQLNKRIKEVNSIIEEINHLEFGLKISIRQQDSINNKIKNR